MSNKELDNLFKNKLEDFEKSPASSLWDRIDEKLEPPKKRSPWLFLSIAASLLLLISFSYLFLKNDDIQNDNQQEIASNNTASSDSTIDAVKPEEPIEEASKTEQVTVKSNSKEQTEEQKVKEQKSKVQPEQKQVIQLPSNNELTAFNEIKTSENKVEKLENNDDVTLLKEEELTTNSSVIAQNSTTDATNDESLASEVKNNKGGQTLVFDISQFENSKTTVAATETDKKESKLLQIFNKAKDIKQGESGLGEIRAAKNNLLAFGGKKEGK